MTEQNESAEQIDLPGRDEVFDAPVISAAPAEREPITLPGSPGEREPVSITRIAHSSVLIDFAGKLVLTDPWFTETMEYHHGEALAMGVDQLPRLTAVVASHAHYDHYDIENFARYAHHDVPLLVGRFDQMAERARDAGFTDVRELTPGDIETIDGVEITALPGAHVVQEITYLFTTGSTTVYFGADTLLTPEVRDIARQGPFDIALLPVNGLCVGGEPAVSSAEEAAVFAGMLQAAVAIPIHYRFHGGPETDDHLLTYNGTPSRFLNSLRRLAPDTVGRVLETGEKQTFL
jgi:L-ascorbate metabolism protein UlaG (beta-lactamase superfamily)